MITLPGSPFTAKSMRSGFLCEGLESKIIVQLLLKFLSKIIPLLRINALSAEYEITRSLDIEGVIKAYSQRDHQRTLVIFLEEVFGYGCDSNQFHPMPLPIFLMLAIALTDLRQNPRHECHP